MKTVELKNRKHNEKIIYWGVEKIYKFGETMDIHIKDEETIFRIEKISEFDIEIKEE